VDTDKHAFLDALTDAELQAFKAQTAGVFMVALKKPARAAEPPIVAEGDSWFDYLPGTDIIDCLRHLHGYTIHNFADAGDTLENMIYGSEYGSSFSPKPCQFSLVLEDIDKHKPKVFLFSGGGNDIAGTEFEAYLDHAASKSAGDLRHPVVEYMFAYFEALLQRMIDEVVRVSPGTHIIMHGYAPPIPTGRGVQLLGFKFAGPWLRPALAKKKIDPAVGRDLVQTLIDRYNELLMQLAMYNSNFHHADLRSLVDPQTDWVNELHLRNSAYARAADHIHAMIQDIQGTPSGS
jgi:hypothetical protein